MTPGGQPDGMEIEDGPPGDAPSFEVGETPEQGPGQDGEEGPSEQRVTWLELFFDLIFVMTGGGPGFATTVLVMYLYQSAFQNLQMGYASAMGVVLFLLLLSFTAFQWRVTRQGEQA